MSPDIYDLAEKVGKALLNRQWKLVSAESCTGGGLSYAMTHFSGSSDWFERGLVTYSNAAKESLLGVKDETLIRYGAVSEETAKEMAEGALKHSQTDISVAITGIAGPTGGSDEKPVGTVWIAIAGKHIPTQCFHNLFKGTRENIRQQSIIVALQKILEACATSH